MKAKDYPATPEHDKRDGKEKQFQLIGEFIDWLRDEAGFVIVDRERDTFAKSDELVAGFFGVDYKAWRAESDAVLAWVQAQL